MKEISGWYIILAACIGALTGILFFQVMTKNIIFAAFIGIAISLTIFSFIWKVINTIRGIEDNVPWGGGPN